MLQNAAEEIARIFNFSPDAPVRASTTKHNMVSKVKPDHLSTRPQYPGETSRHENLKADTTEWVNKTRRGNNLDADASKWQWGSDKLSEEERKKVTTRGRAVRAHAQYVRANKRPSDEAPEQSERKRRAEAAEAGHRGGCRGETPRKTLRTRPPKRARTRPPELGSCG